MNTKKAKKFGLQKKLVIFVTLLAITTYTISAFFINFIKPQFFPNVESLWFELITYALGITWSGILAVIFGRILTKPLQQLEADAIKIAAIDMPMPVPQTNIPRSNSSLDSIVLQPVKIDRENSPNKKPRNGSNIFRKDVQTTSVNLPLFTFKSI